MFLTSISRFRGVSLRTVLPQAPHRRPSVRHSSSTATSALSNVSTPVRLNLDVKPKLGKIQVDASAVPPGKPVYMDMQATTPMDPRVLDAMMPLLLEIYGNPHSGHMYGDEANTMVEQARQQVADLIGADSKDIVFTSGATESNNIAVKGVARFYRNEKRHIVTLVTEHKCVLDSCRQLQQEGFEITYLPVQQNGIVDLQVLEKALRPDTALVSVMTVNNEIGVLQPIAEIGALCKKRGIFFHTDAAQAVGKIPLDVNQMNIDLMSISGHKIYGPKGVGAIYIRRRPRVKVEPVQSGGGQERNIRSGTVPAPLVVGLGTACAIAKQEMARDTRWVRALYDRLLQGLMQRVPNLVVNGDMERRYHGNLNVSFAYVEGESLLLGMKAVACSSGSACTSASLEPSYVLRALGVSDDMAHTSIRFGIGRFTTVQEVDLTLDTCAREVDRLRQMSPLWDMVQEGIDISKIEWSQTH